MYFINYIGNIKSFQILLVLIIFDIIFGVLRSIKEKKLNSSIGINGMIRKVGMILSVLCMIILEQITNINLIGFIPNEIMESLELKRVGIDILFLILFNIFELLSILKNMMLCELPIPKKLQYMLEKVLKEYTEEIKKEGVK